MSTAPAPRDWSGASARAQLMELVGRVPHQFDFYQVLRRVECLSPDLPRLGTASRLADEPIRLGQEPSVAFAPAPLAGVRVPHEGGPPRLMVNFFGLLGPNGPLPLHLTEYARDRMRNADDPTMSRFLDLFHHRMLLLLYRAWAAGQPTANHDRPESNRFVTYVGALVGLAQGAMRDRDDLPDYAKLFYAGRLGVQTRNAEGLAAMVGDFFGMPARIEQFVGDWLDLPVEHRWALGRDVGPSGARGLGRLGLSTVLGARAWAAQQKFRVALGPLSDHQFRSLLPGTPGLRRLTSLVRSYIGDELAWDVRLTLDHHTDEPWLLNRSRLAWTAWLGRARLGRREDLVLTPELENRRAA